MFWTTNELASSVVLSGQQRVEEQVGKDSYAGLDLCNQQRTMNDYGLLVLFQYYMCA